jgi:hypothetical protein
MTDCVLQENYILFDCPGQVELFTHHHSLRNIFFKLQRMGIRVSGMAKQMKHQNNPLTDLALQ